MKALVQRCKDRPFALIGIDTDTDRAQYLVLAAKHGITWRNTLQGGKDGPLSKAWGVHAYPSTWVIDVKGMIRFAQVRGQALAEAVEELVAETERR